MEAYEGKSYKESVFYEPQYCWKRKHYRDQTSFSNMDTKENDIIIAAVLCCHNKDQWWCFPYPLTKPKYLQSVATWETGNKVTNDFTFIFFFFYILHFVIVFSFIVPEQEKENIMLIKFW